MFELITRPNRNRFSLISPGKMGRQFWQAHMSDGDPEKYTLEEAKAKLKADGLTVMMTQTAFDGIIRDKYTEAYAKAKTENTGGDAEALKADNEKLKNQITELKKDKPDMIPKAEHEALLKAKEGEVAKRDERITGLMGKQRDAELYKAAANSVDPEAVVALIRDKFQIDEEGKIYQINDKGEKVVDGEGYVAPDKYVQNFLKEKPHFAKASDTKGAGSSSTGSGGSAPTGKYTAEQLSSMSIDDYAKAGGLAALAE